MDDLENDLDDLRAQRIALMAALSRETDPGKIREMQDALRDVDAKIGALEDDEDA